jgi:hypothetical protein
MKVGIAAVVIAIARAAAGLAIEIAVASQSLVPTSQRRKAVVTVISNASQIVSRANTRPRVVAPLRVVVVAKVAVVAKAAVVHINSRASNSLNAPRPPLWPRLLQPTVQFRQQPRLLPRQTRRVLAIALTETIEVNVASAAVVAVAVVVVVAGVGAVTMAT